MAEAIVGKVHQILGDQTHRFIVEPSAGNGVFVRAMRKQWPNSTIAAVELRLEEEQSLRDAGATYVSIMDLVAWVSQVHFPAQVIAIGNPPFSLAQQHLEAMFHFLPAGSVVAFLLRFSFFGGKDRNKIFWKKDGLKFLRYVVPIAPRPSFKKGTTDNSEYAIYIFEKGNQDPTVILDSLIWEKKKPVPINRDKWGIINLTTKAEVATAPSKAKAMKLAEGLNTEEEANGRPKSLAVCPRGS